MLSDVVAYLRCPVCGGSLDGTAALRCPGGHTFDVARQGYVNLLTGAAPAGADTAEMVGARAAVLRAGHFAAVVAAVVDAAAPVAAAPVAAAPVAAASVAAASVADDRDGVDHDGLVIDSGAGTGHYLAAVLDAHGGVGLALDIAKPAVRVAARAHARVGAAVCDVWRALPVADACARVVLDVFAPRNPDEFHRALRRDGVLVVATPRPGHLRELVTGLGLLGMDPDKQERLDARLADRFHLEREVLVEQTLRVGHDDALRMAAMGPSSFHQAASVLAARVTALPDPMPVSLCVQVRRYRPEPG